MADITYLRTWEGWLYLVAVQDLYSRRIVGWSMADHMRTELVTDALQMALTHRRPGKGLIWHTDQGGPFNHDQCAGQPSRRAEAPLTTCLPLRGPPHETVADGLFRA